MKFKEINLITDIKDGDTLIIEGGRDNPNRVLDLYRDIKVKVSNDGTEIILQKKDNSVNLSVCDEGVGISDEEKKNIFKKFYRTGNEETRKTKGTGLGLYIVKYLVEENGGSITVKNNSPRGTIVDITFYE